MKKKMHVHPRYAASCTLIREVEFDSTPSDPTADQLSEVIGRALDHFPDSDFKGFHSQKEHKTD